MITTLLMEVLQYLRGLYMIFTTCCKDIKEALHVLDLRTKAIQAQQDVLQAQNDEILNRLYSVQSDVDRILEAVVPPPATGIRMLIVMDGQITQGTLPMSLIMTDTQKFAASVSFVDAKGNPAQVEGVPAWNASDPSILTVTPAADGLSAEVVAVGPLGTSQVSVTADADLGEGVTPIVGVLDVQVVAGQAVAVSISTSAPVEQ